MSVVVSSNFAELFWKIVWCGVWRGVVQCGVSGVGCVELVVGVWGVALSLHE